MDIFYSIMNYMNKVELNKKIITYLAQKLGSSLEGKKKIMKLFFILEHIDLDNKKLLPEPFIGNKFSIYYYGVYSESVMKEIYRLVDTGLFTDGFPLMLKKGIEKENVELENKIKDKLDKIITKYGNWSGYKLELATLKILGLDLNSKKKYVGLDMKDIIQTVGSR